MPSHHRSPGAGRPLAKPNYSREEILQTHMAQVVAAYMQQHEGKPPSLASIGEETGLNPIKVRKLLITAGVYQSEVADCVQAVFERHQKKLPYKKALLATAAELKLSRASVTSYLPYEKVVYMKKGCEPKNISVNAERMRLYRERNAAVEQLHRALKSEKQVQNELWNCIVYFQSFPFLTATGLPFRYELKKGQNDEYTRELWVSRMGSGKPLVWSSVWMAFQNAIKMSGEIDRPKAISNIRGVSYIYPILWRFGVIEVPAKIAEKMKKQSSAYIKTNKDGEVAHYL